MASSRCGALPELGLRVQTIGGRRAGMIAQDHRRPLRRWSRRQRIVRNGHECLPAFPFSTLTLRAPTKDTDLTQLQGPRTIGDDVRRRRRDLALRQQVAATGCSGARECQQADGRGLGDKRSHASARVHDERRGVLGLRPRRRLRLGPRPAAQRPPPQAPTSEVGTGRAPRPQLRDPVGLGDREEAAEGPLSSVTSEVPGEQRAREAAGCKDE
jgi:hypothetical protein